MTYGALGLGSLLVGAGLITGLAVGRSSATHVVEPPAPRRRAVVEDAELPRTALPPTFIAAEPPSEAVAPSPEAAPAAAEPAPVAPPPVAAPAPSAPAPANAPTPVETPPVAEAPPPAPAPPAPAGEALMSQGRVFNDNSITSSSFDQEDVTDYDLTKSSFDDGDLAPDQPLTHSSFDDQDVVNQHPTGP